MSTDETPPADEPVTDETPAAGGVDPEPAATGTASSAGTAETTAVEPEGARPAGRWSAPRTAVVAAVVAGVAGLGIGAGVVAALDTGDDGPATAPIAADRPDATDQDEGRPWGPGGEAHGAGNDDRGPGHGPGGHGPGGRGPGDQGPGGGR